MTDYPGDIYTEPSDLDVHTLRNLGPLTGLAGIWEGTRSLDVLHVATALVLESTHFVSYDARQLALASAAGLKVLSP